MAMLHLQSADCQSMDLRKQEAKVKAALASCHTLLTECFTDSRPVHSSVVPEGYVLPRLHVEPGL